MKITRYTLEHEAALLAAIDKDPDWDMFTKNGAIDRYRRALGDSIAYVCYDADRFCGYVRALLDDGFAVYVSELYVVPECRSQGMGRLLLERIKIDYSGLTVYVLSDEDAYYEKLGLKNMGSVYKL